MNTKTIIHKKFCNHCEKLKSLSEYYKDSSRKDKLSNICKKCQQKRAYAYNLKRADKIKISNAKYRAENKEYIKKVNKYHRIRYKNELK